MATYSVTLSDSEIRAMDHICDNADSWIQSAFSHRVLTAINGLSDLEMAKAMKFQTPIVTDRHKLVENSNEPPMSDWLNASDYHPNPDNPFQLPVVKIAD
jgi:hypothetical protein